MRHPHSSPVGTSRRGEAATPSRLLILSAAEGKEIGEGFQQGEEGEAAADPAKDQRGLAGDGTGADVANRRLKRDAIESDPKPELPGDLKGDAAGFGLGGGIGEIDSNEGLEAEGNDPLGGRTRRDGGLHVGDGGTDERNDDFIFHLRTYWLWGRRTSPPGLMQQDGG